MNLGAQLTAVQISPHAMRDVIGQALGQACVEAIVDARARAAESFQEQIGEFPPELLNDPGVRLRRIR